MESKMGGPEKAAVVFKSAVFVKLSLKCLEAFL